MESIKSNNSKFSKFETSEISKLETIKGGSTSYNVVDLCDGREMVEEDHSFLGIHWTKRYIQEC
ncbi:hypothetical protein [Lacihabitans sp. LS3-19]|uniref:hypothetical protein n=1 Tax=Lacihabitans sp. LS3-19 TaxID=2487335 RepID=UPI0020CDC321|nr:hypothetical protein [Lacihabitans sp. LS3-19]